MNNKKETNEIPGWNWGAFFLAIPWGFGNRCYLPLLTLIPIFGLVWYFVCGLKGNEWALARNNYRDIEEFNRIQETWNRAGLFMAIIYAVFLILYFVFFASIVAGLIAGSSTTSTYY